MIFNGHSRPCFHHLFNLPCHKLVIFLAQTLKADAVFVRYFTLSGLPQARWAHRARLPLDSAEDEISNLVQHILSFVLAWHQSGCCNTHLSDGILIKFAQSPDAPNSPLGFSWRRLPHGFNWFWTLCEWVCYTQHNPAYMNPNLSVKQVFFGRVKTICLLNIISYLFMTWLHYKMSL